MERYPAQPGYELVLDARRLIIACVLVIFVCGVFFVLGFVEGKRQILEVSIPERGAPAAAVSDSAIPKAGQVTAQQPATAVPETPGAKPAADQQTWYDKVNAQGRQAKPQPQPASTEKPASAATAPTSVRPAAGPAVSSAKPGGATFYACQVGAFRQQKEAQVKADELRNRGYNPVVEAPGSAGGLYLLKVGRFATRAEAVAMQTRLKGAGYNCFIKTTR
jgi:cell division protein FtsN